LTQKTLLTQVMRIHALSPCMESDLISTRFPWLFTPLAPVLTPNLLNYKRQSSGLMRQPQVS